MHVRDALALGGRIEILASSKGIVPNRIDLA